VKRVERERERRKEGCERERENEGPAGFVCEKRQEK